MLETKQYIQNLLKSKNIEVSAARQHIFEKYVNETFNIDAVKLIKEKQQIMLDKWILKNKIEDILAKQIVIPNATVGKPYYANLQFEKLGFSDITNVEFEGLEQYGLTFNPTLNVIEGDPSLSGDFKIKMKFNVLGEELDTEAHEKMLSLVVNANPKSLWKNIASAEGKDEDWKVASYWKEDNANDFQPIGDKHIVVASKRGRSHANVGSFRDDDYAFKHFDENGWSIVGVADGAGSAKLARQGSKIACDAVIEYFSDHLSEEKLKGFDQILLDYHHKIGEDAQKKISHFVYNNLSKAAQFAHYKIEEFATKTESPVKDFHSTLIFALFKKYDFGYAILTFGVGDCPIGLLNKDLTDIKLMNWLDVGEFGGGTRFITMPEIFTSEKFSTRFGFTLIEDFSYLMLMTDGIYDAKFVVEANLEKLENWKTFVEDLKGNNEDGAGVNFESDNEKIAEQLSAWMDFWSPGNHDDRTLAVIF
ncbi:PP2C family serine/threonine-protein phosphatase [Pedobacter sp. MC2016-05]|uniref:PP2C family serine/threonine-protein phosphatase n=1 Tax=Pedobacter sp. MC2016-05 TaxID=2994474 RepID=UPI00224618B0|nr:PP2C family serine/threonine-protein phosphatase [Pedobacter sp. MC2016-05]MCX2473604.1 PP2C family serine/threonine-protein phosphatase [Pedobacter sp. MC2016-05]